MAMSDGVNVNIGVVLQCSVVQYVTQMLYLPNIDYL